MLSIGDRRNARTPAVRCTTSELTQRGTNRPDARAAIADAAFVRSCGNVHAAMQPTS